MGRKRHGAWHHRLVGVIDGELEFVDGSVFDKDSLKKWKLEHSDSPRDGQILEDCPIAEKIAGQLARHLVSYGGAFLIIDYGKNDPQGDSLQAVAAHKPANIFLDPGSADLSHWVDFSVLRRAALDEGARFIGPITQGSFLSRIGIGSRAERAANASKKRQGGNCFLQLTDL